jgi:hypothetical protein
VGETANGLPDIEGASAADGDDKLTALRAKRLDPSANEVQLRLRLDLIEYGDTHSGRLQGLADRGKGSTGPE